jgi:hypothetical protein
MKNIDQAWVANATVDALMEKWELYIPQNIIEVQGTIDFLVFSSPSFVSGFMMDVGGVEMFVSLDVLRRLGFRVDIPYDNRRETVGNVSGIEAILREMFRRRS